MAGTKKLITFLLYICIHYTYIEAVLGEFHCERQDYQSAICPGQNITSIPATLEKTIVDLILPYNNITKLKSYELKIYPHVRDLNLDHNKIRSTNNIKGIYVLRYLKRISLSGNDIQVFDFQDFSHNVHLKEITANNNSRIVINDRCVKLPHLERLSLNSNALKNLSIKVLKCLPNLKYLDLRRNNLHSIAANLNSILPNLRKILIFNNPLTARDVQIEIRRKSDFYQAVENNDGTKEDFINSIRKNSKNLNGASQTNGRIYDSGVTFTAITLTIAAAATSAFMIVLIIYIKNR